jgi:pilus assembly protein CpaF
MMMMMSTAGGGWPFKKAVPATALPTPAPIAPPPKAEPDKPLAISPAPTTEAAGKVAVSAAPKVAAPPVAQPAVAKPAPAASPSTSLAPAHTEPNRVKLFGHRSGNWDALKEIIHKRLIDEIDLARLGGMESQEDAVTQHVLKAIAQLVREEAPTSLNPMERDQLIEDLMFDTTGLGPLEYLLRDDTITEVMINGPDHIFIERKGQLVLTDVTFRDNTHLLQVIDRIVSAVGRRVDESQPLCDARLKDGSRFNCVIPPLALDGALVTIRKFSKDPLTIDHLIGFGSLTPKAAKLLQAFVLGHLNIIISGGTGSGKTTLLNVLSSYIPEGDRIVTIEDTAELQLRQTHVARMETRPANLEGRGEISMRDLVKNALRMRPERIVVGECRAGEALDMLQAMNTGHDGSLTTLHANTPRDAMRRLETMVMMAGYDLPVRAIREQIASAVHVVIQASRLGDGSRRVMNITEILGMEGDVILMQDIFKFKQRGIDENGKAIGQLEYTGIRPKFLEDLLGKGVEIDLSLFEEA